MRFSFLSGSAINDKKCNNANLPCDGFMELYQPKPFVGDGYGSMPMDRRDIFTLSSLLPGILDCFFWKAPARRHHSPFALNHMQFTTMVMRI
jgi:hypothetical protein